MVYEIQTVSADGYFAYKQSDLFTHAFYKGLEIIGIHCLFHQECPYQLTTVYNGNRHSTNIPYPESITEVIQSFVDAIIDGQASFNVG